MSGARDKILGANLLAWYQRERRSLPWRDNPTPYRIMLSEFMLQQTRVDTVLEYFQRFTERWPTLQDLALSEEEEVVKAWPGLATIPGRETYIVARSLLLKKGGFRTACPS